MNTDQHTKYLNKKTPNVKNIAKSNFPILSMLFFFFFFFFFLNSRNSITVVPIGVKLDNWTSFGES